MYELCSSFLAKVRESQGTWGPKSQGNWGNFAKKIGAKPSLFVTIPKCCKDVYVNNFLPLADRLWNSLPIECFPLTYNLNGFKSGINRPINCRFSLKRFPVCFNLFVLLFLVTPSLVVAFQTWIEWIPILKS